MSARELYDAGFTDLVCVTPPDAVLSPSTRLLEKDRGKAPGRRKRLGWVGYDFNNKDVSVDEIEQTGANTGLRGGRYPGLDIDVDHPGLSRVVQVFAEELLGPAPVRLSREPRRLLVYRLQGQAFGRLVLKIEYEGQWHKVEWLGDGLQYVVHGPHPSGIEYRWDGRPLWEYDPDELPPVGVDTAAAFLDELAERLTARGVTAVRIGNGARGADKAPPQDELKAPSEAALVELPLPPNPDDFGWDEFVEHGYAYKAAAQDFPETGYAQWLAWSAQHPDFDPDECEGNWPKFKGPFRVGWSWLCEQAGQSTAADDFEVIPVPPGSPPPASGPATVAHTDEWVVQQLLPEAAAQLRFLPAQERTGAAWRVWNGHRWADDRGMQAEILLREMLRRLSLRLQEQAALAPTKAEGKPYALLAARLQSANGIRSIINLIRAPLAAEPDDFDQAKPYLLNTPGGVVDLRTGAIRPARPDELLSRSTAVAPVAGPMPGFQRFLEDISGGDVELQLFLQRQMGYSLTAYTNEKTLAFMHGGTDTGKSQWIALWNHVLGSYAQTIDAEAFVRHKADGGRIPADIARLPGVRFVTATEPSSGRTWDEKVVKQVTGGDMLDARFLHGQWFSFRAQFKLVIVGNEEPQIAKVDDAMLRRIHIVPLDHQVPRDRQIADIGTKLFEAEGPAILAWAVEGAQAWAEQGLNPPASVLARTSDYADDEDILTQWFEEECEVGPDEYECTRQELFASWSQWCRARGEDMGGGAKTLKRRLYPLLKKHGFREAPKSGRRGYRRLRVRPRAQMGTEEM